MLVIFRLAYLLMDRAATATQQQALELFGELGDRYGQAHVLNGPGVVQRLTGGYAAAASQPPAGTRAVPRIRRTARPGRNTEQPR